MPDNKHPDEFGNILNQTSISLSAFEFDRAGKPPFHTKQSKTLHLLNPLNFRLVNSLYQRYI
jgi:hypothetical protein